MAGSSKVVLFLGPHTEFRKLDHPTESRIQVAAFAVALNANALKCDK